MNRIPNPAARTLPDSSLSRRKSASTRSARTRGFQADRTVGEKTWLPPLARRRPPPSECRRRRPLCAARPLLEDGTPSLQNNARRIQPFVVPARFLLGQSAIRRRVRGVDGKARRSWQWFVAHLCAHRHQGIPRVCVRPPQHPSSVLFVDA